MSALSRVFAALVVLVALLTACAPGSADRTEIIVTTTILGDITRAIVGDAAPVAVLMRPGADPHSFAVSARDAAVFDRAALVVHNGLGLEEGVARHVTAAADAGNPTLAVGEHVDPLAYSDGVPDPHFWTDPRRVRRAATAIGERVAELDGVDAAAVRQRTADYLAELDRLDRDMADRFAALPAERRVLVTNHHVFGYLAQRFDFRVLGAVVPSGTTLAAPSAADLDSLATAVRTARVGAIFVDSSQPDRLARVLAERVGLDVRVLALHTESLSEPGGGAETYLDMMRANTAALVAGLSAP
ncbi:zinc ABC transporter substrate-binding protein AztC [Nocardia takedensis]